jgi:hypothetical protein
MSSKFGDTGAQPGCFGWSSLMKIKKRFVEAHGDACA